MLQIVNILQTILIKFCLLMYLVIYEFRKLLYIFIFLYCIHMVNLNNNLVTMKCYSMLFNVTCILKKFSHQ